MENPLDSNLFNSDSFDDYDDVQAYIDEDEDGDEYEDGYTTPPEMFNYIDIEKIVRDRESRVRADVAIVVRRNLSEEFDECVAKD